MGRRRVAELARGSMRPLFPEKKIFFVFFWYLSPYGERNNFIEGSATIYFSDWTFSMVFPKEMQYICGSCVCLSVCLWQFERESSLTCKKIIRANCSRGKITSSVLNYRIQMRRWFSLENQDDLEQEFNVNGCALMLFLGSVDIFLGGKGIVAFLCVFSFLFLKEITLNVHLALNPVVQLIFNRNLRTEKILGKCLMATSGG